MNKRKRQKGAEMIEFTLAIVPLLMCVFVLIDACWGMFAKATLAYAVHAGVRRGVTVTGADVSAAGAGDLTTLVKNTVQANALGLLAGPTGRGYIKVKYYKPPDEKTGGSAKDVSTDSDGNNSGNIMQVSVEGFQTGLIARIYNKGQVDKTKTTINAVATDLIEPTRDQPDKGTAP
jgi:hypothetical protein